MSTARTFRHARSFLPGGERTQAARDLVLALLVGFWLTLLGRALAMAIRMHATFMLAAGHEPARWIAWMLVFLCAMAAGVPPAFLFAARLQRRHLGRIFIVDDDGITRRGDGEDVRIRWSQVRRIREARWAPKHLVIVADHARLDVGDSFIDETGSHAQLVRQVWSGRMPRTAFLAHEPAAQSRELRDLVKQRSRRAELVRWPLFEGWMALVVVGVLLPVPLSGFRWMRAFDAVDAADVRLHCHDAQASLVEAERAVGLAPRWGLAHAARAEALAALDRVDEALVASDRAVALDPQVVEVHRVRARVLEKAGRREEAAREMLHVGIAGKAGRAWRAEIARLLGDGRYSGLRSTTSTP